VDLFLPSLSFLAEAQPRLENRRGQKALKAQVHETARTSKQKTLLKKLYLPFSNTYIY
jgi:hypothetical protein